MRTGDELDAGLGRHHIERHPDAAYLIAVHRPIGLILMPGRAFGGAGFLDQDMLVKKIDLDRAHHPLRHQGGGGLEHETAIFVDAPPVAIVAEEEPRRTLGGIDMGETAGLGDVARDPVGERGDPLAIEDPAQHHRAVAPVNGDVPIGNRLEGLAVHDGTIRID